MMEAMDDDENDEEGEVNLIEEGESGWIGRYRIKKRCRYVYKRQRYCSNYRKHHCRNLRRRFRLCGDYLVYISPKGKKTC